MPALTCNLDEVLSSLSSTSKSADEPFSRNLDGDIQLSSTSLASLLGLSREDAVSSSAERAIVARHLIRALTVKARLSAGIDAAGVTADSTHADDSEGILLACHRVSAENVSKMRRRIREITANSLGPSRLNSDSKGSKNDSTVDAKDIVDGTLEGTPLLVDFVSLDLPSELLDTPSRIGDGDDFDFAMDGDMDWIEPLPLSVARQLASSMNISAYSRSKDGISSNSSTPPLLRPPLWVACDGTDDRSIVLLSTQKFQARGTLITTITSRSVTTIDAQADVDRLFNEYREEDDDGDDGDDASRNRHPSPIRISAFYLQRMSVLDDDVNNDEDEHFHDFSAVDSTSKSNERPEGRRRQMVIEINCSWDSPVDKRLLQTPSVTDKLLDCQLHLTIGGSPKEDATKLGEGQARILSFYEDMKKLEAFLRGLTSGGRQLVWFPYPEEVAECQKPLIKRVEELLRREKQRQQPTTPDASDTAAEKPEETGVRLDFVAKLWNLLKHCGSSHELQDCLNRAVFSIVNASSIDALPTVFSISTSNVAKRIVATQERLLNGDEPMDGGRGKGSYRDDNPLIGLNPLLLLAELGIDKLRQEYHSFSTNLLPQLPLDKLVSGSSIYGKEKSSNAVKFLDPKDRCLSSFHRLVISHYVVDSLVQIKTFFASVNLEEAALKMAGVLRKQPPKNMGDFKTMSLKISLMEDVKMERLKSPTSWMLMSTLGERRVEAVHVSPFKALPIKSGQVRSASHFFLTRVSSVTHSLGR